LLLGICGNYTLRKGKKGSNDDGMRMQQKSLVLVLVRSSTRHISSHDTQ
jgi:hypothetical protein